MTMMKKFLRDPAFLAILIILVAGSLVYWVMADDKANPPKGNTPIPITKNDEPTPDTNNKSLELYQQYYNLQRQRDIASQKRDVQKTTAFEETQNAKQRLASDSSDIEVHRQLLRAQIEGEQADIDWLAIINPIDEEMGTIRSELKNRGEPPPH